MAVEFESEQQMEERFMTLLRDGEASTLAFGEEVTLIGHQVPVARTEYGTADASRPRRLDVACVDSTGRLVICELKTVLDEKLLLQGLAYARLVQQNLPAWEQ